MSNSLCAASRDAQWKKVDEAINKGLPRTAIDALEPIIQGALQDRAWGEATKAIARKIVLEGNIQGNKPEEKITRLEAEIAKAPKEIVPLLDTILANWYWHYFQNNRWRFMQRTATAQAPGKDFTTWDLTRLFAEIDRQFQAALAAADRLKATPIATFDSLLQKGSLPDAYRPTLYDFIGQEALRFYTAGEQAAAKPQDAFEVSADGPVFAPAEQFLGWKIGENVTDTDSPPLKAFQLYQELLKFHQPDKTVTAFLDLDLARLVYGYNVAFGEAKNLRYKTALKNFVDRWGDHELAASALHSWARVIQQEGDLVEARSVAQRGAKAFPASVGGKQCQNLVLEIEARSAAITAERIWNAPWPKIQLRYRNVTEVHFRAVAWEWNVFKKQGQPEWLDESERKELLAKAPALEWSAKLPATTDFKERLEELPAPERLKPGFYFLIASHDPGFTDRNNQVTFTGVWVSDLALVVRPFNGKIEGFVLAANSGEPIAGAEIMAWSADNQGNRAPNGPPDHTDENGFFSMAAKQNRGALIRVQANLNGVVQELGSMQEFYSYAETRPKPSSQTIFFTDRALYRPGQTIQYKGICLEVDQEKDNYEVLPARKLTVFFLDTNGKEIAKAEHQSNDYGSFAGSFTAPRDRLPGRMQIHVAQGPAGAAAVNVEEYKRPKFQVTLEAPRVAAKLNDKVSLSGHALSYTGAAVDGAQVTYRVVRQVRWPYWWSGYYRRSPSRAQASQETAHGTARTETDGSFMIEFIARPDPSVSEKDEASFSFVIHVDVTDPSGETRSAERSVNVGFAALAANLSAADWQTDDKPVEVRIQTTTLDGEAQAAEGSLKIYRLKEPAQAQQPPLGGDWYYSRGGDADAPKLDMSNPNNWELADAIAVKGFTTDAEGKSTIPFNLGVGVYRAMLETQDRFGKKVTARLPVQVLKPSETKLAIKVPHLLAAPDWSVEPGQEFTALWGTGYEAGRAFIEIEHRRRMLQRYWTKPGETQSAIKQAVTEAMRGGFTLHVTQVRENRAYLESRHIEVPWNNKSLEIKWEHFVSKLQPGQKETWTAVITGPGAHKAVAEMAATLYDESLDAFLPHSWLQRFGFFRRDYSNRGGDFANALKSFQHLKGAWEQHYVAVASSYRSFPPDLMANLWGYQFARNAVMRMQDSPAAGAGEREKRADFLGEAEPAPAALAAQAADGLAAKIDKAAAGEPADTQPGGSAAKGPDLSQVTARKNLNETAFFFPQLLSDQDGVVRLEFTLPEALTRWKFMGFAHDAQCRSGFFTDEAVTAKDLMVQPNPPRFLREGDTLEFTVKVSNQTATRQEGKVRLTFNESVNDRSADRLLGNSAPEITFDIPAKESRSYAWRIKVPDGMGFLSYKAVGAAGRVSDGEEGFLPVLSRQIFLTESLPLPIRGPATKRFEFARLLQSGKSATLRQQGLTVQMVSNPAWYAVLALPYLMEYPYECSEQTFNRLYANALARSIANSDPKIHRVFAQWRGTPALDSPLEKNQDLKSLLIEETPWLRQAQSESQARKNIGILFDDDRLSIETDRALQKLSEMQLADGSWPWFPGGRGNDYITLYITTGFGRLRHLGVDLSVAPAIRAFNRLDSWIDETYRDILKLGRPEENHLSETIALYLYGRSFFLKDKPVAANHKAAVDYFLDQARTHWLKLANRQSQGHLAIALKRFGDKTAPPEIMKSIRERSVSSEELGMYWRETELSWWWYRAPIETQALMIEAFDEVMNDAKAVEECRVWLLKQKQTQDWKTTKATADAVYALLLRGRDLLASEALVEVSLGGTKIGPAHASADRPAVEAGTGFYEKTFAAAEVKPKLGEITVTKTDQGVAWGSIHWQYFEDMTKVTPYEGTPLRLKKTLYTKTNTKKGQVLEPWKSPLKVGDELVVRLELRVDRDMEYVHLKDQRGSGTEPVNVISRYKYQDGLAYYESTRDTASHFFIDYLPKGAYVFEYSTRIQHRGQYQTGMAEIQCLYAPEFNSHSESFNLVVE